MSLVSEKLAIRRVSTLWILGITYVVLMAVVFSAGEFVHRGIHDDFDKVAALEVAGARLRGEIAETFSLNERLNAADAREDAATEARRQRRDAIATALSSDMVLISEALADSAEKAAVTQLNEAVIDTLLKSPSVHDHAAQAFDTILPLIENVSALVIAKAVTMRKEALGVEQGVAAVIATVGFVSAVLFLLGAVPGGRRLMAKDASLREAHIRLQHFAQTSSDIFWEIDGDGIITHMEIPTNNCGRVQGAEMVGRKFRDFLASYNASFVEPLDLGGLWRGGRAFKDLILRGRRPDSGEAIWYSFSGIPIYGEDGRVRMYRCAARDVTSSEKLRQDAEVLHGQLEAVISHLSLVAYRYEQVDGQGRLTFATDNVERLLGVSIQDLNNHSNADGYWFLHPEDRERVYADILAGIRATGVGVGRGRVVVDGETRWIKAVSRLRTGSVDGPISSATYSVEGFWCDVTDDVRNRRRLSDFMSAIDSSSDLFIIADADTRRIEYCNAGYMRLLELPEDQPLPELYLGSSGKPVGSDLATFLDKLIADVKRDGRWVGEQDWQLNDGSVRTQFVRISLLSGNRLLITLTDITPERVRTRELQNITKALEASADGFLTYKKGGGPIMYANPSVNRIIGAPEGDDLRGRHLDTYITPLDIDIEQLREETEAAVARGECVINRRSFRRCDGSVFTALSRASSPDDETILIVMTDITEITRLERQVGDQRSELDRLIRNLPGVAYRLGYSNGGYIFDYASSRLAQISGYAEEELAELMHTSFLLADPAHKDIRSQKLDKSRETGEPYEVTWSLRCKDGSIKWVYEKGNHFVEADGTITVQGYAADITDRVRYEEELKLSREENLGIVRALGSAHEAIAILDGNGRVTYANPAFEQLMGVYGDEGTLLERLAAFGERQGEVWQELVAQILFTAQRDGHWTGEMTIWTKEAEAKRLRVFVTRGDTDQTILLASDVTEEAALRESQERQTNIVALLATDRSVSWTNFKSAAARIVGAAQRGLLATQASLWILNKEGTCLECIQHVGAEFPHERMVFELKTYAAYWEFFKRERIVSIEDIWEPGPASMRPYITSPDIRGGILDVPIMRAGQVVGVLTARSDGGPRAWTSADKRFAVHLSDFAALALETSERQDVMSQLRTANERLQAVVTALDSTQDRIAIEGLHGRITYVNRPLADAIGGGQANDLIGQSFMETIGTLLDHPEEIEEVRQELDKTGAWSGEMTVHSPRGRRHLDVRVSRLNDGGVLYAATDKTEKHERDQEEAELKRQLADAQRMETIGRLAGGIAHDFNNIIGAVRGFADLIADELPPGATHQVYATRIVNACQRAADLVRDIMTFSRAAQGKRHPVRMKDILSEGMSMMADMLSGGVELTCINGVGETAVKANPSQMIQVITNLAVNSRDAIARPDGRISIRAERYRMESSQLGDMKEGYSEVQMQNGGPLMHLIEGSLKLDQDYVRLSVEDNGSGMSKNTLLKVFEPFFTTKDRARGTGLGLPTVASIVSAHRGAMRIITRPDQGTCFDVFIPVTYKDPQVSSEKQGSAYVMGQERLLIVDDEVDLADAMSIGLQRLGYEAAPIYNPCEALELFKENPHAWDVVITDQVMPEMQGMRLVRKLKALRPGIKIILYTGHSETATEPEVKKIGADIFLYKPVTAEQLAGSVRSLFSPEAVN